MQPSRLANLGHLNLRPVLAFVICFALSFSSPSDARPASNSPRGEPLPHVDVRIGVLTLFHPHVFTLSALPGQALVLRVGEHAIVMEPSAGADSAEVRLSGTQVTISEHNRVAHADRLLVAGRNGEPLGFILGVPGKITRRYYGTLEIEPAGAELIGVVTMDQEDAVSSIVAAESEPDTPLEALKAQAVATRSYLASSHGRHREFEFCDTTHCQFLREPPPLDSNAMLAATSTRGMVLTHNSSPFPAMYTRRCSGHTRTPEQVGLSSTAYPYYSVACDFCLAHPDRWTTRLSHSDAALLRTSNEHDRLAINRRLGWDTVPSNDFVVNNEDTRVVISGVGRGHGIGLCQAGSKAMAQQGASYAQILAHYYPGADIKTLPGLASR